MVLSSFLFLSQGHMFVQNYIWSNSFCLSKFTGNQPLSNAWKIYKKNIYSLGMKLAAINFIFYLYGDWVGMPISTKNPLVEKKKMEQRNLIGLYKVHY